MTKKPHQDCEGGYCMDCWRSASLCTCITACDAVGDSCRHCGESPCRCDDINQRIAEAKENF